MSQFDIDLLEQLPQQSDEDKHLCILAGLADVDAGRTISHEEMKSWVKSLFEPESPKSAR
jgi:predicted transcriptional regulator